MREHPVIENGFDFKKIILSCLRFNLMNYQSLIAFVCLVATVACNQDKTVKKELPSGLIVEYEENVDGEKNGQYLLMTPDEDTLEKSYYVNDLLQGTRTIYTDSGTVEMVELYEKGKLQGDYKGYYPSGTLKYKGKYNSGEMKGVWTFYYETGDIKEKVTYDQNEENGPFSEYDESGTLRAKGKYLNGDNENGLLYLYDDKGAPARVMDCDMGVCITQWTPDSTEVSFDDFK